MPPHGGFGADKIEIQKRVNIERNVYFADLINTQY